MSKKIQVFWNALHDFINETFYGENLIDISLYNVMFNLVNPNPANLTNFLILLGKQFMYRNRCLKIHCHWKNLYTLSIKLNCMNTLMGNLTKHCKKWFYVHGYTSNPTRI